MAKNVKVFLIGSTVGVLLLLGCTTVSENQTNASDISEPVIIDYTLDKQFDQLKKEIVMLDSRQEYKLSYALIETWLSKNYSFDNMHYAIKHAEEHFKLLHQNNTLFQKSTFYKPPELTWKDYLYTCVASAGANFLIPGAGIVVICKKMSKTDKINFSKASEQNFLLSDKNIINSRLTQYNILKQNMIFYLTLLEKKYTINADEAEKDRYFALRKRMENLKQRIMDSRCNFVSYHAISPALAEASKLLYLATFKYFGFNDKQKIKDSVIFLCRSFHKEWLYTASEDVRIQFCDVVKEMKDVVGGAEWKEFETLTTLLDSADNSKKRGASAWWDEK